MYRRCTHCAADLGANEAVESFPVGRRLAFDGQRGRLWVVCRRCERWNLTPLEERWEALEELERAYRDTRTRYSTENIGLARLREGLEVVRIGRPVRPEFAAWRYGDPFGRRRLRVLGRSGLVTGGGVALGAAAAGAYPLLPLYLGFLFWVGSEVASGLQRVRADVARIPLADGSTLEWRYRTPISFPKLRAGGPDGSSWHLRVPREEGEAVLTGSDAMRGLSVIMPRANPGGGSRKAVRRAVRELERAGDPHRFMVEVDRRARRLGHGYATVAGLPPPLPLALEMAAHEENERRALEGELRMLERQWREAEEIAAIADQLAVPRDIRARLAELRRRVGRRPEG